MGLFDNLFATGGTSAQGDYGPGDAPNQQAGLLGAFNMGGEALKDPRSRAGLMALFQGLIQAGAPRPGGASKGAWIGGLGSAMGEMTKGQLAYDQQQQANEFKKQQMDYQKAQIKHMGLQDTKLQSEIDGTDAFTLGPGMTRWRGDKQIAQAAFKPATPKPPMNDFQIAQVRDMIAKGADMGMDVTGLQSELQAALFARASINGPQQLGPQPSTPATGQLPGQITVPPAAIAAATAGKPFHATQTEGGPLQFQPIPGMAPRDAREVNVARAKSAIETDAKANERENKRSFGMEGISDDISAARQLLSGQDPVTGKAIEKPTASGIGKVADSAAAVFGKTLKGAKTADRLRSVGAAMTAKMPRFEGPQSDADRAYYIEMAGKIGDDSIPVDRRLAALAEVERGWSQFERGVKGGFAPSGYKPSGDGKNRRASDTSNPTFDAADAIINGKR